MAPQKTNVRTNSNKDKFAFFVYKNFPSIYKLFSTGDMPETVIESPGTKHKPKKPKLPTVNLLPPRLAFDEANRRTRRGILLSLMAVVILMGTVWIAQADAIRSANLNRKSLEKQFSEASTRAATYQPIGQYFDNLQQRLDLAAKSSGEQIDYSRVVLLLKANTPPGTQITEIEVKVKTPPPVLPKDANPLEPVDPAAECGPVQNPFQFTDAEIIGCIKFSGTTQASGGVAQIIQSLSSNPMFASVYAEQASVAGVAGEGIGFSGTAALTGDAAVMLNGGA